MDAYIVAGYRTAVGKAQRGGFRFIRPDDLAVKVINYLLESIPNFDKKRVEDLIVGNAMPEAEQGLNMARMISLMCLDEHVGGVTVNRYCGSGLETIAMAAAKIQAGYASCIIAGGTESMSLIPMGGYKVTPNYTVAHSHPDWYFGMGHTAEAVAQEYKISRDDCDAFAFQSHQRAIGAIEQKVFEPQIVPIQIEETYVDEAMKRQKRTWTVSVDEGPRADTSLERLAKLKPVFAAKGVVTAGNSSQTSDGAAFVLVVSEQVLKEFNLTPLARLAGYAVRGVSPRVMGIGPVEAIPLALKNAGLNIQDIAAIELNEAFATQALAVIRKLNLDPTAVNPNGGAIALGHPLGCTGAKLTVQVIHEVKRRKGKYGMVTACIGGGQGIAGIFEVF
jgi:acetyl-CoA acyltransferase